MTIGVLGGGAWGTALAVAQARHGRQVVLWMRSAQRASLLQAEQENARDLPGVRFPDALAVTAEARALASAEVILAVVPAQALRETLTSIGRALRPGTPIVICAKGIERATGAALREVVGSCCPTCPPAALSGPSFAAEVGAGLPTAVTIAAASAAEAEELAERLATPALRLYHTDDLTGVELGGAAKNVLAIACGIAKGRGLGASAGAALMARAFAELMRLGRAVGARPETLMGLSGLGDLVLTCNAPQSRNFSFGVALGQGLDADSAGQGRLVEGRATAPMLRALAADHGVAMPIVDAVDDILAGRLSVAGAVEALLSRPPRAEDA
jgi:glycerol-3-phosphate dehydrogenase (NAD(P)+)